MEYTKAQVLLVFKGSWVKESLAAGVITVWMF
jgi:hypothetical protein